MENAHDISSETIFAILIASTKVSEDRAGDTLEKLGVDTQQEGQVEISQSSNGVWIVYSKRKSKTKKQINSSTFYVNPYTVLGSYSENHNGLNRISEDEVTTMIR